ncbi:zf-HC2 domain-containing protein [Micromonospora sp. NPDC047707]|uniref:anti-sigma factor family protein n=1 Tax=unclassified Micromonospora TaxID=2617518 RepID=UPI0012B4FC59|nr:zf-HC2 domain-containing protein [Micromonospora sp. WMMC415]QGN46301.1 anti-sigma factor [Micromonospora sp. WMMC415]
MRHDHDDATIGAYLAGELPADQRDAFEEHLLTCDRCWAEVDAGRRGRTLAMQAYEPAPARLLLRAHAAVTAEPPARHRTRAWVLVAAVLTLVATLSVAAAVLVAVPDGQPAPIAAAVAGYHDEQLPGSGIPLQAAPDLSALRLAGTAAGTGRLAGHPVTGYAYRDDTGRRLLIYLSDEPFPMPARADHPNGPSGSGITHHRGVVVLCSRSPHTVLVLGEDQNLVRQVAAALDLG